MTNLFDYFHSTVLFSISFCLYRASFTYLISLNLSCNLCLWYYTNWSTLIKKLMQTYIVKVSGSILNISTVHLNGIWHLLWRYLSKPVLGGHPVLSGHYSIPRGCPLNTGFTVLVSLESKRKKIDLSIFWGTWGKGGFFIIKSWKYLKWIKHCICFLRDLKTG